MSAFAHPIYNRPDFETSTFPHELSWRGQYSPQISMLAQQWPNQLLPQMSDAPKLDMSMFPDEPQHYSDVQYSQYDTWSDLDTVGTPSNTSYSHDVVDSCFNPHPAPSGHLQLPAKSRRTWGPMSSPQSSYGSLSPIPSPMPMPAQCRTITPVRIPERSRKPKTSSITSASTQDFSASGEEDTVFAHGQCEEQAKKSRKRARIPHTAVERRYRENLNSHLDKLRQNVPSLVARQTTSATGSEAVKPSKCEILNGAIDHIGSLGRENTALKNEVAALRAKIGDYDAWCRGNMR